VVFDKTEDDDTSGLRVTKRNDGIRCCDVKKGDDTSGLLHTLRYVIFVGNSRVPRNPEFPFHPVPDFSGIPKNRDRRRDFWKKRNFVEDKRGRKERLKLQERETRILRRIRREGRR
jgi:hypothetical protein